MHHQPRAWHTFVLGYIVLVIGLLTISPFQFQAFVPSEFWVFRASVPDVSRNILLFLPFGIVLNHAFKKPHWVALLCGFGLSLSIECTQLFIVPRTSNVVDLFSNSSGALLGSLLYTGLVSQIVKQQHSSSRPLPQTTLKAGTSIGFALAFLFVPLCWLNAFRSINDPMAAWLTGPNAIAGITLIQATLPATSPPSTRLKYITALAWSAIALIPLINTSPAVAPIIYSIAPLVIYLGAKVSAAHGKRLIVTMALGVTAIALWRTTAWALLPETQPRLTDIIMRVAEIMLSATAAALTGHWAKTLSQPTQPQP